jgi:hypothetical protein
MMTAELMLIVARGPCRRDGRSAPAYINNVLGRVQYRGDTILIEPDLELPILQGPWSLGTPKGEYLECCVAGEYTTPPADEEK